ncbi:MAG TPA: glycosyltransferase family 2 protein [Stellaceae bacterium]|nr:glycosyltransferase family 2 protein [Stellaceae bacterium]
MSEKIAFTIVIPSYNQGAFIDEAILSLLRQHDPDLEIIVMDGGSSDDTVDRLRKYGEAIAWVSERDGGQAEAIAKGFSRARNPWLAWLNSDDIQCNDALAAVRAAIGARGDAEVVVGKGHYMDRDGGNPRPYPTIPVGSPAALRADIFTKGYLPQPSVFFRKSLYDRVGGINRSLKFCLDYELWARFVLADAVFVALDRDISGNRWYATTKSAGQTLELLGEVAATQVRLFGKVSPYFVQAISDHLYHTLKSVPFGDRRHLFYRWLYFKSVWIWLNGRSPAYCLRGLMRETIAKSGPLVGDRLRATDLLYGAWRKWVSHH